MTFEQCCLRRAISGANTQKGTQCCAIVMIDDSLWHIVHTCARHEETPAKVNILTLSHGSETGELPPGRSTHQHICSRQVREWAFETYLLGTLSHIQGGTHVFIASEQRVPVIGSNHAANRGNAHVLKRWHKLS